MFNRFGNNYYYVTVDFLDENRVPICMYVNKVVTENGFLKLKNFENGEELMIPAEQIKQVTKS